MQCSIFDGKRIAFSLADVSYIKKVYFGDLSKETEFEEPEYALQRMGQLACIHIFTKSGNEIDLSMQDGEAQLFLKMWSDYRSKIDYRRNT